MNAPLRSLSVEPAARPAPAAPAAPVRPAPVRAVAPAARPDPVVSGLDAVAAGQGALAARMLAGSRPWWFAFPGVMLTCANVVLAPLGLVVRLAEAAVALVLLGAVGAVLAWHLGYVADRDVVAALKPVGQRILSMVQSAGAP